MQTICETNDHHGRCGSLIETLTGTENSQTSLKLADYFAEALKEGGYYRSFYFKNA